MTDTAEVPAFTAEAVHALMRGHLTVVKPGETLVIRADRDMTPNQIRELQDYLDRWHFDEPSEWRLPFRAVVLPGNEFTPVVTDSGGEKLTFAFEGKPWTGTPVVNGHPVYSATEIGIRIAAQEVPEVTLTLMAADGLRLLLGGAQVSVDDQTREALVSLGWIPPEDAA